MEDRPSWRCRNQYLRRRSLLGGRRAAGGPAEGPRPVFDLLGVRLMTHDHRTYTRAAARSRPISTAPRSAEAWARLTSDAPVGRIRATVRAGRDRMRATLLGWLPATCAAALLDAGCGTGALARRGGGAARGGRDRPLADAGGAGCANVCRGPRPGSSTFRAGDMLDPALGRSTTSSRWTADPLRGADAVRARRGGRNGPATRCCSPSRRARRRCRRCARWAGCSRAATGRPPIAPVAEPRSRNLIAANPVFALAGAATAERIASGFYTSQALELGTHEP